MTDTIGVGLVGCGFIGQFHSWALVAARYLAKQPALQAELIAVTDMDAAAAAATKQRFGWQNVVEDWRALLDDERIQALYNATPNFLHTEPSIAAAKSGRHVFCEKPLAPSAGEAHDMWRAAHSAGIVHMCAFVKRFVPALNLAREMIRGGELGEIQHFRADLLLDTNTDPELPLSWRLMKDKAGSGAAGDVGAHLIDQARWLVGEPVSVSALTKIAIAERPGGRVDVDDAFTMVAELEGGALATLVGSRIAGGHGVTGNIRIEGTRGALAWDMERLNELQISDRRGGFRTMQVTRGDHPFGDVWWAGTMQGKFPISWVDCFTLQTCHFLNAVAGANPVAPQAATFEDGYRVSEVVDAILLSAESGERVPIRYRTAD